MHIVIAGPGALGCLLAARLATVVYPDDDLVLLDHHQDRARQLNTTGFTLEQAGKLSHYPVRTTADPGEISGCDFFLLCTRAKDVNATLARAKSLLSPETLLITFQRGIRQLNRQDTGAATATAISSSDVFRESPGHFRCLDPGTMVIGLHGESTAAGRLLDLVVERFNRAGLKTQKSRDIRADVWKAFFLDLAINALAAIYRRPYGQLLTSCSVRGNLKKTLQEAMAVTAALEIPVVGDPVKTAFHILRTDKEKIAPMLRDIQNKHTTEIDALNGALTRLGRQLSIPTPINADLELRIRKLEEGYRAC